MSLEKDLFSQEADSLRAAQKRFGTDKAAATAYMEKLGRAVRALAALPPEQLDAAIARIEEAPQTQPLQQEVVEHRPDVLECDVVRFQNNKEKWVAFVGLLNGHPYEIFTGLQDDDEGIVLPKAVTKGRIIKATNPDGTHRYDFQFSNRRGYKTTVEGLSEKFNKEYWNYAKLISGVLRYRMPLENVIRLVGSMQMESESINTWTVGVERALKKYVGDGVAAEPTCPDCGSATLELQDGAYCCRNCGATLPDTPAGA